MCLVFKWQLILSEKLSYTEQKSAINRSIDRRRRHHQYYYYFYTRVFNVATRNIPYVSIELFKKLRFEWESIFAKDIVGVFMPSIFVLFTGSDVGFLDLEDFIVIVKEAINPQSDKRPGRFQNLMQNIARGINLFIIFKSLGASSPSDINAKS